ncbi:hypothetical protein [Streptomyces sp. NPDC058272]|uniref:hypothetical protein n=1 Tax=Streptomyces sp. NPDC058272 TaxID=3346415 RepID=UPI0036F076BD
MPEDTPTEGEIVPPIVDYDPEEVEPEPQPEPTTPPSDDGSSIIDGPHYPAPGEVTE